MRKEDVPQDEKYFSGFLTRDVYYVLNDENNYEQVLSLGWDVKNEALGLTWDNISEEAEEVRHEVLAGKKSPLAYHLKMSLLDVGMLSSYTDIPKRKIKKHLQNDAFQALDEATLKRYANAMNITVEELRKV